MGSESSKYRLHAVSESRITESVAALWQRRVVTTPEGMRFIDIDSEGGLSSLAAHCPGADVTAYGYNTSSVRCTLEVRGRYANGTSKWHIMHGYGLTAKLLPTLDGSAVVYFWSCTSPVRGGTHSATCTGSRGPAATSFSRSTVVRRLKEDQFALLLGDVGMLAESSVFLPDWLSRCALSDVVRDRAPWFSIATHGKSRGLSAWHG